MESRPGLSRVDADYNARLTCVGERSGPDARARRDGEPHGQIFEQLDPVDLEPAPSRWATFTTAVGLKATFPLPP